MLLLLDSLLQEIFRGAVEMLLWLFLPLASGWWWDEKMDVNKRVEQQEEEDLNDYLEDYRGEVALERMDLGEYAYYYYEYPEDRQAGTGLSPLAALIAPLAGLALMGAAASVAVNPLLLKLVTISNRRRRSLVSEDEAEVVNWLHQLKMLRQFFALLPDKANPLDGLTADYLVWSGLERGKCLDRLACSYASNSSVISSAPEREVVSIVLYNLMTNQLVKPQLKDRLRGAAHIGRAGGECLQLGCKAD